MGALKLTACMKVVAKMGEMDQESLLERLDRYTADGVPKDRAQVMAAADTLAELQDERREFMRLLREQHPQLFVVSNVIPEDRDVDPDAPDIKLSADREPGGAREVDVFRGRDIYFPKGNEKGEFYEPLWVARSGGRSAHGRTPEEARKNLVTRLGEKSDQDGDITRSPARNDMGFYSALAKGVEDMQTKQAPAGAWKSQIKGLVNKGQVKQDEIEWSGIEDFLDLQQGKVSKDQVLEYLRGNGVQVDEVKLADKTDVDSGLYTEESPDEDGVWLVYNSDDEILESFDSEREAEDFVRDRNSDVAGGTKYGKYTLPGGKNYREVLLTLPERPDRTMTYQVLGAYPRDGFKSREEAQAYIDSLTSNIEAALADPARSEVGKVMQAELNKYPFKINEYESKESRSKDYHSNHWEGQPNVLAHIRLNDRVSAPEPHRPRKLSKNFERSELASQLPLSVVESGVAGLIDHDEVRRAVVSALPVDVVDMLGSLKLTPEQLLGDKSVSANLSSAPLTVRLKILSGLVSALGKTEAGLRAKVRGSLVAGLDEDVLPALRASDLDPAVVRRLLSSVAVDRGSKSGSLGSELGGARSGAALSDSSGAGGELGAADRARLGDLFARASLGAEPAGGGFVGRDQVKNPAALTSLLDRHTKIINDRTDADGKRVLFVEEIQSDWGQEGKKKGFPGEPMGYTISGSGNSWQINWANGRFDFVPGTEEDARTAAEQHAPVAGERPPVAPFVTKTDGWLNLALKRVIAMAVDGGYDAVAFVNGDQSADRYDLSKQVESVSAYKVEGGYKISAKTNDGDTLPAQSAKDEDEIASMLGKELATKIVRDLNADGMGDRAMNVYSGLDLKVGGEGMKAFYDKIVPNAVKALLKKVGGGQMRTVEVLDGRERDVGLAPLDDMPNATPEQIDWQRRYDEAMEAGDYDTVAQLERTGRPELDAAQVDEFSRPEILQQPGFDVTDAMREKVSTEGLPLFSRKRDVTETPEFQAWSGGAPVVEFGDQHDFRSGQPVVVESLHGTTNEGLTKFDRERANIESDWGAGFYSSNTPDDVAANYATSEGADLTNRIERLAETLAGNEFDDDMEAARQEAKRRLTEDAPNTLKLYVSFQNPAVLGGNGETFLDWNEPFNEETEEYGEPTGKLVDFIEAVRDAAEDFDVDDGLGDFIDGLISSAEGEGVKLSDVMWQKNNTPIYAYDRNGDSAASELIRRGLEGAGFDGVIDTTVNKKFGMKGMNDSTVHFIAFQPEQMKSATGNRGTFDRSSADITRSPGRTATGAAWDSPSASKWDDAVYKLQDKQVDLRRVTDAIQEAGGAIADDLNVYLQEELYHGRAAKRTEDFVNMELNPLVEQLARDGLQLEDLEEFLHARHAKEANDVIAQRNPGVQDLQDGGSGMKTGDAQQYLASLPADLRQKLESAAAKVDAILEKTRELYVDYELESRETVDAWGRMFQHYIPLMREDKDGNGSPGLGQGFSVKGRETKGRTGSTRKVVDIMANIAMQRERAIVRGEKNRVSQALVGLATANPNEGFWQVDEVPTERVFNEKTGLVEDRVDPLYKSRPNAVIAKIKGANGQVKEHAVLFNEEDERAMRMAAALKNLDADKLEGLMGVSAMISRYFAASVTQWNPLFGPVNMIRDVQAVALNLSSTPIKGEERKVLRNVMPALAGVYKDLRAARKGKTTNTQWAKLWEEFQDVGGQTGYRDLFRNSEERANAIKKVLDPDAWAGTKLGRIFTAGGALKVPLAQARRAAAWIFDWLSDYNDALENGVRLAVYKAGLDRGLSKEQAASIAKNASTNFNRKGQIGQQAGALYAFFNAAVQGTARIGDTLFDMEPGKPKTMRLSSAGKKIVGGGVLLGAIQAMMLAAAGYDDEDPPQFARERSLIIPIGDKKYVSIPMPLGFNVIPNIGRIATEFALGGFKDPHERAVQLISLFSETFNPIGSAGLSMQTLAPTALDPLVALTENKDWTGKPIARESSNPATPGHALAKDTATTWSKAISEAINTLSGGNKYVAGVFSPSPDQVDYLLSWATGGVGREISKLDQTVSSLVTGEELPPYKIPLVGRFYGNARSQSSEGTAFYANTAELNKLETEIKGLEKDGKRQEAAELRRRSDAYLITMANQAERQIQKLRAEKRELVKADAPREQVIAIDARITAVMARLNRAVESLEEKSAN